MLFLASFLPWFRAEFQGFDAGDFNGWDVGFLWAGVPALLGILVAGVVLATKVGSAELPDLPVSWSQVVLGTGVLSALLVFAGTSLVVLQPRGFAAVNALLVVAWLVLAWRVGRTYAAMTQQPDSAAAA